VTITAPGHPLYRRSFKLLSVSHGSRGAGFVEILYREGIAIRVPMGVTDLSVLVEAEPRSKLTANAVRDLLALVKEYEPCLLPPKTSGAQPRQTFKKKSSRN
jgi:hypothetical protein